MKFCVFKAFLPENATDAGEIMQKQSQKGLFCSTGIDFRVKLQLENKVWCDKQEQKVFVVVLFSDTEGDIFSDNAL